MNSLLQPCLAAVSAGIVQRECISLPATYVTTGNDIYNALVDFIQPYNVDIFGKGWISEGNIDRHLDLLASDINNPDLFTIELTKEGYQGDPLPCPNWSLSYRAGYMAIPDLLVNLFADVDYSGTIGLSAGIKTTSRSMPVIETLLSKSRDLYLQEGRQKPYPLFSAVIGGAIHGALKRKAKFCDEDAYYIDLTGVECHLKHQENFPSIDISCFIPEVTFTPSDGEEEK
ncbi:hypothetical protein [Terasakiella sp.]|uniref:hypothetical protein n=1 Tax=Terasakiella sp. TaxID=2034861 RepID=UPI003AA87B4E